MSGELKTVTIECKAAAREATRSSPAPGVFPGKEEAEWCAPLATVLAIDPTAGWGPDKVADRGRSRLTNESSGFGIVWAGLLSRSSAPR